MSRQLLNRIRRLEEKKLIEQFRQVRIPAVVKLSPHRGPDEIAVLQAVDKQRFNPKTRRHEAHRFMVAPDFGTDNEWCDAAFKQQAELIEKSASANSKSKRVN